jgi:predicted metalloprotease
MRWERGHTSGNVIDRRGAPGRGVGVPIGIGGVLVLGVLSLLFGRDFVTPILDGGGNPPQGAAPLSPGEDRDAELVQFVSFVLDDTQATWRSDFDAHQRPWRDAQLVLFTAATDTGCGPADTGVGPFYCPRDERLYIDLSFYRELRDRFGAPGDFAQAYVIAHEVGHHVQHVLGIDARTEAWAAARPDTANDLSVRMELQADCFAGIWARSTERRQLLEPGDMEEAMGAAAAVGDDVLERRAGMTVQPDTFTHGSAEQRMYWLHQGYRDGLIDHCDTFTDRYGH